jgi:DNA-binding winged helix-turn-helix (wHTH) protein
MLTMVWGFDHDNVNLVEVHVSALRRKLEASGPRIIHTVRGAGYALRPAGPEVRTNGHRRGGTSSGGIHRPLLTRSPVPA